MDENNNSLLRQFTRIQWLLQRCQHEQRALGFRGNPYRGQARILKLLTLKPEISQKDLSELLDMRPQSLGELLAKLERKGYVTRTQLESDRRVMNIQLTEEGRKAADQDDQQMDDGTLFSCLSQEEQSSLSEWLDRIIAELEQQITGNQEDVRHDGQFRRTSDTSHRGRIHGENRPHRRDMGERRGRPGRSREERHSEE